MKNVAILAVDFVNEFVHGNVVSPRCEHCLIPGRDLINAARKNNIPVIFANDTHDKTDRELAIWGEHSMRGTDGCKVIDEIGVVPSDIVVEKHTYGAFFNTNIKDILNNLGVKTVIVCGLYTNICVKYSAVGAYLNGFDVIIAEGATDAFTEETYIASIEELKTVAGAKIVPYTELITEMNK